jgi:hypothetical protein
MYFVAILLLVVGTSCAVEIDEPSFSDVESEVTTTNKITVNKITVNKITVNQLATAQLAASSLDAHAMLDTEDRREVLTYIVSCALPAGEVLALTDAGGATYEFPGSIGLAPAWATRAPTVSERRWVTACVLARTNLYGVSVPISMRHDTNPALAASTAERAEFSVVEGAFYGDLFQESPVMYACGAKAWSAATPETERACALSADGFTTDCGFTYTGACNAAKQPCQDPAAPFGACAGDGVTYPEVVTIYMQR